MKSYIIHFIRHGSIDETLSGKYIGTTDVPLSDKGKQNLENLITNIVIRVHRQCLQVR